MEHSKKSINLVYFTMSLILPVVFGALFVGRLSNNSACARVAILLVGGPRLQCRLWEGPASQPFSQLPSQLRPRPPHTQNRDLGISTSSPQNTIERLRSFQKQQKGPGDSPETPVKQHYAAAAKTFLLTDFLLNLSTQVAVLEQVQRQSSRELEA